MTPVVAKIGTAYGVPGKHWAAGHHTGVDFLCITGTPIHAPAPSVIKHVGWGGWGTAYGIHVIGETTYNGVTYRWLAAHLSKVQPGLAAGSIVDTGHQIGLSGATGNVTGPHLHFEVRVRSFLYGQDVNPSVLIEATFKDEAAAPKPGTVTVFDACSWNVASPKWFTAWAPRAAGIATEIHGEASVYCFQEAFSEEQAKTISGGLGTGFARVSGPAGLEFFYDSTKWEYERSKAYPSGIQGRYAQVVHLVRKATGQHVAFVNFHAPALYPDLRTKFGAWLARLIGAVDGPVVVAGDFNTSKHYLSPRKDIEALGYKDMRTQAVIENEGADEFPSKKSSLADIYTLRVPGHVAITGGQIDLTASRLSDHRRLEARISVTAR